MTPKLTTVVSKVFLVVAIGAQFEASFMSVVQTVHDQLDVENLSLGILKIKQHMQVNNN